jgi:hypothetical protein
MRTATWIAALALASLAAAAARADGVRVLDELEGARTDLFVSMTAAQARSEEIGRRLRAPDVDRATKSALKKELAALRRLLLPAGRALAALDTAVPAFRRNDMPAFFKAASAAAVQMHNTVRTGEKVQSSAWLLDPACTENLAGALRTTLEEATALAAASGAKPAGRDPVAVGQDKESKGLFGTACGIYLGGMSKLLSAPLAATGHDPVVLRGLNGAPVNIAISVAPYSPRQTCGACHDYETITKGYHFDQGRKAIRDDYAVGRDNTPPYVLSDGMFGKW